MDENADEVEARIGELREGVDKVDCELVSLLNERAALALKIRELKPKVRWALYDPKREEQIFTNLSACNAGPLFDDDLREIFEVVLRVMKEL